MLLKKYATSGIKAIIRWLEQKCSWNKIVLGSWHFKTAKKCIYYNLWTKRCIYDNKIFMVMII